MSRRRQGNSITSDLAGYVSVPLLTSFILPDLVKYVDAPDLAGHGSAARLAQYSIQSLARDMGSRISGHYDVIVGSSFGGPIALQMVSHFGLSPQRIVLCDPVLDADLYAYTSDRIETMALARHNLPSENEILEENPSWERLDACIKLQSALAMDPPVVRALFAVSPRLTLQDQKKAKRQDATNGECSHTLLDRAISCCSEIIIIAAEPARGGIYPADHDRPSGVHLVQAAQGAHDLHRENYELVARVILSSIASIQPL